MEIQINIDCADPDALMAFYAEALGYRSYGSAGGYRSVVPKDGEGPKIVFQKVPESKVVKNRMHLDLVVDDIEAHAARFESLGARRLSPAPVVEHGGNWIVMADPEGNELCLCDS
jgi:predicted enzyme related to lactoylglutathione lyase